MNTCGDEVLAYPPDILNGLKAFRIGLCIAFGLAALAHVAISNIRSENIARKNMIAQDGFEMHSNFLSLLIHLVPIGFVILQETSSSHLSSFSEERVQIWEEIATFVVFTLVILARSAAVDAVTVLGLGFFVSSYFLLRSGSDDRVAKVLFGSTIVSFLLLTVVLLRRSHNAAHAAVLWAEQQSGVMVLRGVFLLFAAAQLALHALQRRTTLEAPFYALCSALLAGCVRHVFVVVCCESHPCYTDIEFSTERCNVEDADEHWEVEDMASEMDFGDGHREEEGDVPALQLTVETTEVEDSDGDDRNLNVAWSPSPTQVNLLDDDRDSQEHTKDYLEVPGVDGLGSPELFRSNSSGMSEQHGSHLVDHDNASRRQLLRYVFHEMRAPLNSISMAVDLLTHHSKKGTPKNKFQDLEALQIIEEATLTMERTLKDTMTLQKIDEGLLVAQWKIFSVHSLCDDIKDALKQVLRSNSVTLNYTVDTEVPDQIVGDHFRIRHVVAHVLSNAIKFSRAGGVVALHVGIRDQNPASAVGNRSRTCSSGLAGADISKESCSSDIDKSIDRRVSSNTAKEYDLCPSARDSFDGLDEPSPAGFLKSPTATSNPADGKCVVISITDNGIGMSSELQESDIFKPFNQLKTEEITGFRGSGLGLAICKKIITFLHGSITYSSVEGVGTTFRISFPLTLLDSASMDEVEEEDLPAIELAAASYDPSDLLLSPRSQQRHKAIAKAKSFRGEKLLSILHNQSNVFDCPTPQSCSAPSHFHSRFSSTDESEGRHTRGSSGGSGPASANLSVNVSASVSASASQDTTPRSAASLAKGINVSRVPSIAEELETGESAAGRRSSGASTPPRRAFGASGGISPSRPLGSAASTLRNLKVGQHSRNNSHDLSAGFSRISPLGETLRDVSTFFHTSLPVSDQNITTTRISPPSDDSRSDATSGRSASNEPHMPEHLHTMPAIKTKHSSLSHSHSHEHSNLGELPTSPIGGVSNSQEYVALTEKNVNLHILRTAATDGGIRAIKHSTSKTRKSCSKEALLATLKACKILVVDDAASNRKLLSMMLKRAGFGTVDLVEDGQAAVDYCTTAQSEGYLPKMIFMDNTMPRMTGIDASRIIRQGGYPHLIIGVTGNSMEDELDDFIAAGADLVIVKPLKNHSLEMLLGFIQANGFDSSHGYRIDTVDQVFTWVPRSKGSADH